MFENYRDWAISSEASRNRRTFTDYSVRKQDRSDTSVRNNLHTTMKQRLEDKYRSGIYVIQNNINSKKYVGKAKDIYKRIMQHITQLNTKNPNENRHLINAWHKYGRSCFTYYVIEYVYEESLELLEQKLKERELFWIQKLNTTDRNCGYNMRLDSEGKCVVSEETRRQCSESQTKRFLDPEERKKIGKASKIAHIEHSESFKKSKRKLAYARREYRIAMCDKDKNILKIYDIIQDILNENPNYYKQAIKNCCSGYKNSYKGYYWRYCYLDRDELVEW